MTSRFDQIEVVAEQIGHALKDKKLWVPANQRDYSWKDKHVEDLYSDLALVISRHGSEYFLGSIVVIPTTGGRLMVVDGQQRLATSLILLAAIRDFYDASGDPEGARIFENDYILSRHHHTKEERPHLLLNERDQEYFTHRVLLPKFDAHRIAAESSEPSRPSHKLIDKAAKKAAKRVAQIVSAVKPEHQMEQLNNWVEFLEHRARVIWVSVPDESSAYVIFETMNDRGLELSATDLIKNYLFGRAEDKLDTVKQHWFMMTGALETVEESEIIRTFVRHYWISRHGVVRTQELFDELKRNIRTKANVVEFSGALSNSALKYAALLNPSHSLWTGYGDQARQAIETLGILGIVQSRPLLLSALEKLSTKEMAKLLVLAVSWSVRLLIAGTHGTGLLEGLYGSTAQKTWAGTLATAKTIGQQMEKEVPDDGRFEEDFADANVSTSRLARYYLRALERTVRNDPEPYFVPNDELVITLEHVMPEDRSHWKHIPEEIHQSYSTRIGNLVLLKAKPNSKLGNVTFKQKRPYLLAAEPKLTQEVGSYEDWGKSEIEKQQRRLARLAVKTWPIST